MQYLTLPPEVNSARMFVGAGSGPLLTTAAAWDGLAAEARLATQGWESVILSMTVKAWQGQASASMLAAATPYLGWLNVAAAGAERAARSARDAVSAFEAALTGTVRPLAVAANCVRTVSLAGSNFFGQDFPAIAATEAEYEQMWAQNVVAISGYHADVSSAAAGLVPRHNVVANLKATWLNVAKLNFGIGNIGHGNIGSGNTGDCNSGSGNTGNANLGNGNQGSYNMGSGNSGITGAAGYGNLGLFNLGGHGNSGLANSGPANGFANSGIWNLGEFNSGGFNIGKRLSGFWHRS
ncbi:PPE domain-containing protein [Mycobacterium simiae]|nr:PPE domain-containing protein [Mycobacterium simiae]